MLASSHSDQSPVNLAIRLSLFYASYFLVAGVLFPFLPLLLEARGMNPLQISLLMALALWLRAAAGPLVARQADRSGDSRKPLLACAAASFLVMLVFYWAEGFWVLLLAVVTALRCGGLCRRVEPQFFSHDGTRFRVPIEQDPGIDSEVEMLHSHVKVRLEAGRLVKFHARSNSHL